MGRTLKADVLFLLLLSRGRKWLLPRRKTVPSPRPWNRWLRGPGERTWADEGPRTGGNGHVGTRDRPREKMEMALTFGLHDALVLGFFYVN